MIERYLVAVATFITAFTAAHAAPQMASRLSDAPAAPAMELFRAPQVPAVSLASLPAPAQKSAPVVDDVGRLRVASVRALPKATLSPHWVAVEEGAVNRLTATSQEALGLRLQLTVGKLASILEIRAQGTDGRIETMRVDPSQGSEVWTPWTTGDTQVVELFSPSGAPIPSVQLESVLHFDQSPFQKATASSCTVPVACTTSNTTLDAAIADRKHSSVRITFVSNGSGFVCSATLIDTDRHPAGYLLTANHCISTVATANSMTTFWFWEGNSCADPSLAPGSFQQAGGAQLVFTNHNADSTLLLLNQSPPAGAVYSAWNADLIQDGEPVVSLSHPGGDTTRLALGTMTGPLRITDRAQDEYGVTFSRGIIEGGSSGSGLYTLSGGTLKLRGVLTGTTIRSGDGLTCTNLDEQALYGRFDIFWPEIAQYTRVSGPTIDDTPNRVIDYAGVPLEAVLNNRTATYDRRLEFVGDVDVFRFRLDAPATVSVSTQGTLDTVGTLMDSNGKTIAANDDAAFGNLNFGITRNLEAGTYFVMVAPWEANGAGPYKLVMTATSSDSSPNYTDLWWNSAEAGWGVNLAHQGNIVFATLYTYDANGAATWFYMSNGAKQSDGSFRGTLDRASGPVFNMSPWGSYTSTPVGTMQLTFPSNNSGVMTYSVNGIPVTKNITRYQFSTPTSCHWTSAPGDDRSGSTNYQDLWWNPAESGWGVNIAHQGNTLFATLYTYDTSGQPLWLSMSNGVLTSGVRTYSGALYKSSGPPFNANPWGSYQLEPVGNMTFQFQNGNSGTLTYTYNGVPVVKPIQRFLFASPQPVCSSS